VAAEERALPPSAAAALCTEATLWDTGILIKTPLCAFFGLNLSFSDCSIFVASTVPVFDL
jgi:hypothetical protein